MAADWAFLDLTFDITLCATSAWSVLTIHA